MAITATKKKAAAMVLLAAGGIALVGVGTGANFTIDRAAAFTVTEGDNPLALSVYDNDLGQWVDLTPHYYNGRDHDATYSYDLDGITVNSKDTIYKKIVVKNAGSAETNFTVKSSVDANNSYLTVGAVNPASVDLMPGQQAEVSIPVKVTEAGWQKLGTTTWPKAYLGTVSVQITGIAA